MGNWSKLWFFRQSRRLKFILWFSSKYLTTLYTFWAKPRYHRMQLFYYQAHVLILLIGHYHLFYFLNLKAEQIVVWQWLELQLVRRNRFNQSAYEPMKSAKLWELLLSMFRLLANDIRILPYKSLKNLKSSFQALNVLLYRFKSMKGTSNAFH